MAALLDGGLGIITMCLGFVHNYGSFAAVRALLGIAEGGLLPGMVRGLWNILDPSLTVNRSYIFLHYGVTWLCGLVYSIRLRLCRVLLVVSTHHLDRATLTT